VYLLHRGYKSLYISMNILYFNNKYSRDKMAIREIKAKKCICERCGHTWIAQTKTIPISCAKCRSPYWNRPRVKKGGNKK